MSKKSKLNDNAPSPQVILDGYIGHEDVPDNVTHVRFHPSVVDLDEDAFYHCEHLREVISNNGLREIGKSAFHHCNKLQNIDIPSTVTKIGNYAFHGCSSLTEFVLNEGLREIGSRAFTNCSLLQSITIPSTVTEIGTGAFSCCNSLREIVFSDGLKKIRDGVFRGCTSLESITIPSTVIEIELYAFSRCTNLREVVIHNEGVQIDDKSFYNCSSLERFSFPSLSTRLDNIIRAGQRDIEAKMDDIAAVEWRSGELILSSVRREIEEPWGMLTKVKLDKEKLDKVKGLIGHYEMKEATSLFELALWKARIDQTGEVNINRNAHRVEVPGPVKDTILQYLR